MARKAQNESENEFGNIGQRGVSQEKSVLMTLKDLVKTDTKVYYIMWKYCPELLPKYTKEHPILTFEDLKKAYPSIRADERTCQNYLFEKNVMEAVKWLYNRQHIQKMLDLYDKFYEKAMNGDVQAFKAITEFSDKFFKDQGESELLKLLHGVDLDGSDNVKDENMNFDFRK